MQVARIVITAAFCLLSPLAASAAGIAYPDAPGPDPNHFINAPVENYYFPVRADGQPVMLQTDQTVNMTDYLNRHYYDPNWRGEVWAPWDTYTVVEKGTRLMATWPAYHAATQFRFWTGWHTFWEKWSGYGPQ